MKQKITLTAILFLVALFAFGQRPELKHNELFWKSKAEVQLKGLKHSNDKFRQTHLFQKNKNFSQNSSIKSTQTIKQRLDSLVSSYWDENISQLVNSSKIEFTYDTNMNIIENISYNTDYTTGQWLSDTKEEYTHDTDRNPIQSLFYMWDETIGNWMMLGNYAYYYSEVYVSSVSKINEVELKIYPNPFSKSVSFDISGDYNKIILDVFDIQGRKVISKEIKNGENINMEGLKNGMYIYNLIIDGKKRNGKLIKQ